VLFELLTGRSPFEAETMPELCLKIVSEPPLSLAELRPLVPPALVAVVERCLEKDRDRRYENAAALALALSAFAPPRSSVFSAPLPSAGDWPAPSFATTGPQSAPISGGPPRVASIPAAWGTEGRRESQQPAPRRRPVVAWVAVASLAIGAAVMAFAVNRPRAEHPASEMPPSLPPPATTESAPPTPETLTVIPDLPPVVEPVASAATPVPSADPANRATVLRTAPSTSVAPRSVRPAPRASAAGGALARPDDDIPSLR
jgi:eukaryotic-like serine/threonine-protein kinase